MRKIRQIGPRRCILCKKITNIKCSRPGCPHMNKADRVGCGCGVPMKKQ